MVVETYADPQVYDLRVEPEAYEGSNREARIHPAGGIEHDVQRMGLRDAETITTQPSADSSQGGECRGDSANARGDLDPGPSAPSVDLAAAIQFIFPVLLLFNQGVEAWEIVGADETAFLLYPHGF